MDDNRKVVELPLDDVLPNRFQPRIKFNEESINELAESIKEHGVIQPIVVRPVGDRYEIIAGERRYKATTLSGLQTIPAIITNLNDKESAEVALIENVQRQDLTPIEEAISYKKILDMGYLTQENLAEKLGKNQSTIANKLRLLNLDEEVQEALLNEKISERHARSLLKLSNYADQVKLLNRIIDERLTVRKTDEEIVKMLNNQEESQKNNVEVLDWDEPIIIPEEDNVSLEVNEFNPQNSEVNEIPTEQEKFFHFNIPATPIVEQNEEISTDEFVKQSINIPEISDIEESFSEQNTQSFDEKNNVDNQLIFPNIFMNESLDINKFNDFVENDDNDGEETKFNEKKFFDLVEEADVIEQQDSKLNDINYDFSSIFKNDNSKPIEEFNFSPNLGIPNLDMPEVITEPAAQENTQEHTASNTFFTGNIKTAINTIRTCTDTIEKYGFIVDSEEFDLGDVYQVTIKIHKK